MVRYESSLLNHARKTASRKSLQNELAETFAGVRSKNKKLQKLVFIK